MLEYLVKTVRCPLQISSYLLTSTEVEHDVFYNYGPALCSPIDAKVSFCIVIVLSEWGTACLKANKSTIPLTCSNKSYMNGQLFLTLPVIFYGVSLPVANLSMPCSVTPSSPEGANREAASLTLLPDSGFLSLLIQTPIWSSPIPPPSLSAPFPGSVIGCGGASCLLQSLAVMLPFRILLLCGPRTCLHTTLPSQLCWLHALVLHNSDIISCLVCTPVTIMTVNPLSSDTENNKYTYCAYSHIELWLLKIPKCHIHLFQKHKSQISKLMSLSDPFLYFTRFYSTLQNYIILLFHYYFQECIISPTKIQQSWKEDQFDLRPGSFSPVIS